MIVWKCDGCGKTEETRFDIKGSPVSYSFIDWGPNPPEEWWVASIPMPEIKSRLTGERMYQRGVSAYHACCGTCADKVKASVPAVRWKAP